MKKKGVYRLEFDCGRQGILTGLFVDTQDRVDRLLKGDVEVYFGEALGKHSEIYGSVSADELLLVSDSEEVVKVVEEYGLSNGYNPFYYSVVGDDEGKYDTVGEYIDHLLTSDNN